MKLDDFLHHVRDKKPLDSDAEIVHFEEALGERLPSDYREFLLRCNGGYTGGALWHCERDVGVHHIAGFREESSFSISAHCDSLREFLPSDVIPIADDPFGNAICLGIRGEKKGRIYFWDHESAEDDPELVSDSFAEFVSKLEKNQE